MEGSVIKFQVTIPANAPEEVFRSLYIFDPNVEIYEESTSEDKLVFTVVSDYPGMASVIDAIPGVEWEVLD